MSDIVERLRYWGADDDGWLLVDEGAAEVCLQAADEIERLNAENARLREALEKIANEAWNTHAEFCHPDGCDSPGIARAALAEQGEK